jgi:hypothetical protein
MAGDRASVDVAAASDQDVYTLAEDAGSVDISLGQ